MASSEIRHELRRAIRAILQAQYQEIKAKVRLGRKPPNLAHWTEQVAAILQPLLLGHLTAGGQELLVKLGGKRLRGLWTKRTLPFGFGLDVFNSKIAALARQFALVLAQSTIDTSQLAMQQAIDRTKEEIAQGLERGEAVAEMSRRIGQIFNDPQRAFRIAITESSRATHAGQLVAAQESGVVQGKKWLASSDACPLCLMLNGKVVKLDEPFYVDPKGGPYATVMHPPRHPGCLCTWTPVA